MAKSFEEYKQEIRAAAQTDYDAQAAINKAATDKYISETNAAYDAAAKVVQDDINSQVDAVPGQYKPRYDTNAINEVVARRKLTERMANLGLTDSGLNRTQDTAIMMNKNNADAALGRQQQAEVASLRKQLNDYMASVEEQKARAAAEAQYNLSEKNQTLYSSLMTAADARATELYNADIQAAATRAAASRSSGGSGGSGGSGTGFYEFRGAKLNSIGDETGLMVFTDPSGEKVEIQKGINPYKGAVHDDAKRGTFDNGYQPNNVGGVPLVKTGLRTKEFTGKDQAIWCTVDGRYYIWDGQAGSAGAYILQNTASVEQLLKDNKLYGSFKERLQKAADKYYGK